MTTAKTCSNLNNKPRSLVKSDTNVLIFHLHVNRETGHTTIDSLVIEFIFKSCYELRTSLPTRFLIIVSRFGSQEKFMGFDRKLLWKLLFESVIF